jgi:two-component SAPR family response regulator
VIRVLISGDDAGKRRAIEDAVRSVSPDADVISMDDSSEVLRVNGYDKSKRVQIKTFGEFAVFADGKPVDFRYSKSLELFALIVDRRGKKVDNGMIKRMLWQDSDREVDHSSYISTLKKEIVQTFSARGITDIFRQEDHSIALVIDRVECDYFDYVEDKNGSMKFDGRYMEQYSWAESTAGLLYSISEYRKKISH